MDAGARVYVCLLLVAALAATGIGYTVYGKQMNYYAYDLFLRLRGPETRGAIQRERFSLAGAERIVIVAVDDETLRARGVLPLDRRLVAQGLEKICAARPDAAGPAAVGIDIWFPEAAAPEADTALERALHGCPRVVLGTGLVPGQQAAVWNENLPMFERAAAAVGHAHADPDEDGLSRQVLLEKAASGKRHWALAFQVLRQMEPSPLGLLENDDWLDWGSLRIPASRRAQRALLVNFAGEEGVFQQVSFEQVLRGSVSPNTFAGKAVLLGVTARGVGDRQFTPVSLGGIGMPGVEIHAHLLHTLLERRFLHPLRETTALALELGLVTLVGLALYFLRGFWLGAATVALMAAAHVLPYVLFLFRQVTPAFSLAAGFWLPLIVCGSYQYLTVWRHYEAADATQRRLRRQMEFVTHEMRSPLTTIQGSSELIGRYPLDEKRRKQMADLIQRESQRLSRMVERFLDVERLTAGEVELRREPVNVRAVVESSVERVRPFAERKSIAMELDLKDPGEALGDAELLEFAVYNLLGNAVKYSPEGSAVRVAAHPIGGRVLVAVSDRGQGIPREEAARIFERFYRTRDAETSGKPGLGLGLAIVREIARLHGGEVTVENRPGGGSQFTLAVPLAGNGRS